MHQMTIINAPVKYLMQESIKMEFYRTKTILSPSKIELKKCAHPYLHFTLTKCASKVEMKYTSYLHQMKNTISFSIKAYSIFSLLKIA